MDSLWSAATIKIIGAGVDDARVAEDVSRLVGEHDVDTASYSHSAQGSSLSVSTRRQRILEPGAVRAIPKGRALLLATGCRAAALALRPWYAGPRRDEIAAAVAAATRDLTRRARGDTDPDDEDDTAAEPAADEPATADPAPVPAAPAGSPARTTSAPSAAADPGAGSPAGWVPDREEHP